MTTKGISITFPEEIYNEIDKLAINNGMSRSDFCRFLIKVQIQKLKAGETLKLAI